MNELSRGPSQGNTHVFQDLKGSLFRCVHCKRWFHNEADADRLDEVCDARP